MNLIYLKTDSRVTAITYVNSTDAIWAGMKSGNIAIWNRSSCDFVKFVLFSVLFTLNARKEHLSAMNLQKSLLSSGPARPCSVVDLMEPYVCGVHRTSRACNGSTTFNSDPEVQATRLFCNFLNLCQPLLVFPPYKLCGQDRWKKLLLHGTA